MYATLCRPKMAYSGGNLLPSYVRIIYAVNSHGAEQFTLYMIFFLISLQIYHGLLYYTDFEKNYGVTQTSTL